MAKPWANHQNSSSTSLSRYGFERAIAPRQTPTPPLPDYLRKDLPPIPGAREQSGHKEPLSEESLGSNELNGQQISYSQQIDGADGLAWPTLDPKSFSLPEPVSRPASRHGGNFILQELDDFSERVLPPPPPPPMSKSAQKVLQLTGFDTSGHTRMDKPPPRPPHPLSRSAQKILQLTGFDPSLDEETYACYSVFHESSDDDSSGSQYSQPESMTHEYVHLQHDGVQPSIPNRAGPNGVYLQSPLYSTSESSASNSNVSLAAASASVLSLRFRDRPMKQDEKSVDGTEKQSIDIKPNEEFKVADVAHSQKRFRFEDGLERDTDNQSRDDMAAADDKDLLPQPLVIRTRPMINGENGIRIQNSEITSLSGHGYDGIWTSSHAMPPPSRKHGRKRKYDTGKYPMKSPLPPITQQDPPADEPQQKFRTKMSRAMKRLSTGAKSASAQSIIPNREREANGPDTPMPLGLKAFFPSHDTLQKGNEHLQGAVHKAKKGLRIKTADEKRREELKKQIVVIGITDQSPDGRVSQWF